MTNDVLTYWSQRLQDIARTETSIPKGLLGEVAVLIQKDSLGENLIKIRSEPELGAYDIYWLMEKDSRWSKENILTIVGLTEDEIIDAKSKTADFAEGIDDFFKVFFRKLEDGSISPEYAEGFFERLQ